MLFGVKETSDYAMKRSPVFLSRLMVQARSPSIDQLFRSTDFDKIPQLSNTDFGAKSCLPQNSAAMIISIR